MTLILCLAAIVLAICAIATNKPYLTTVAVICVAVAPLLSRFA